MPSYPVPDNEVQRLQAVAALAFAADTPDPALDALVRVAAQAFEVPAAVISLMQADHQVFVARVGVDVSELARAEGVLVTTARSANADDRRALAADAPANAVWLRLPGN